METIDPVWLFGGIALVSGILIGAFAYMRLNPASGDVDKLKTELDKARSDFEEYKTNVNRHFSKTSDLVSELTQDYVKVYQHLAEGAEVLGNNPKFASALEQSQGRVLISVEDEAYSADESKPVVEPSAKQDPMQESAGIETDGESTAEIHEHADREITDEEILGAINATDGDRTTEANATDDPVAPGEDLSKTAVATGVGKDGQRATDPDAGEQIVNDDSSVDSHDSARPEADAAGKNESSRQG